MVYRVMSSTSDDTDKHRDIASENTEKEIKVNNLKPVLEDFMGTFIFKKNLDFFFLGGECLFFY